MSRRWLPFVIVAVVGAVVASRPETAAAQAWPKMRLYDRGDQVEILVTGVRLVAAPTLTVRNERIEVELAGRPPELHDVPADRTVRRIEIRGEGARLLSVKLRGDNAHVLALLPGVVAVQEQDGVRLRIPRQPPPVGAEPVIIVPPRKAEPERAAATGTTAVSAPPGAGPAGSASSAAGPAAAVAAASPASPSTIATQPRPATGAAANPVATAEAPLPGLLTNGAGPPAAAVVTPDQGAARTSVARLAGGSGGFGLGRLLLAIAAIAVIGGAAVVVRRRRALLVPTGPQLELIASRHLGGKARVVWLGAGDRELVIAVDPQQIRLLGQWRRGEHEPASAPRLDAGRDDSEPNFAAGSSPMPRVRTPVTSAVSGIMRLRGKVVPVADDIATGDVDADEQWARDILSATGGRR